MHEEKEDKQGDHSKKGDVKNIIHAHITFSFCNWAFDKEL